MLSEGRAEVWVSEVVYGVRVVPTRCLAPLPPRKKTFWVVLENQAEADIEPEVLLERM